jgi:hypothetical protein
VEPARRSRIIRPRWKKNHSSERQSSTGSIAFSRHCTIRWVWVKVPSFSTCEAAGSRNTSVRHSSGTISPVAISGEFFQNVALSISNRSRTTSQSRLAIPSRCARPLAEPTAGFWPSRK